MHSLLALCARPDLPEALDPVFRHAVDVVADWAEVVELAEQHGIAPLMYMHARSAGVPLPADVWPQLQALYVSHRRANEIRLRVLTEILEAFGAAGIESRLLKGAALMFLIYGAPVLRPVSDLDILVEASDAGRAQRALRALGFSASEEPVAGTLHHHLPPATRSVEGIVVQVEIHRDALSTDGRASIVLADEREPPLTFDVRGHRAAALGVHDMLWQMSEHLVGSLPRPLRLIWIADVIGFAETFSNQIDWERIAREHPVVLNVLAFAHALTPLRADILQHVPAGVRRVQAHGGGVALSWAPSGGVRGAGRWRQIRRTIAPPAWWLDLRYGRTGVPGRFVSHCQHMRVFSRAARRRALAAMRR